MTHSTPNAEAATTTDDPFRTVADALAMATRATRDVADGAKADAARMMPAVGGLLGRLSYRAGYAVSYGVVFPALLLARTVPRENALVHGRV